jgi:hypothetical protein
MCPNISVLSVSSTKRIFQLLGKEILRRIIFFAENTVRGVIPSKVYRHPGGKGEERAHLLSGSDNAPDYASEGGSTSTIPLQIQAARSVSLDLVKEISVEQKDKDDGPFTDLTEDDALLNH